MLCAMPYLPYNEVNIFVTPFYIVPVFFVTSLLLFHSIPQATDYIYSKNIKFSDLIDSNEIQQEAKERYIRYHRIMMVILLSITISVIVYYYEFIYKLRDRGLFEMFAVIRGFIIQIYLDVQKKAAEILKTILYKKKEYHIKKRSSIALESVKTDSSKEMKQNENKLDKTPGSNDGVTTTSVKLIVPNNEQS
ncbi:MAG: hypothetical protein Edafosvirus9_26 [Edafosvirus sp.]|uniref:Uncharacterized protein n=1 Tax=Edafosvirus sp. TaxID=2487765 RepID=A0A3G4ZTT7_9VIRU|nr:MAG: hypothetical protein Edafosvirus9_26 [Edafosvirus sp.]